MIEPTHSDDAELWRLVERYRDGKATRVERVRLEERLTSEPTTRQFFIAYMQLDAQLNWQRRGITPSVAPSVAPVIAEKSRIGELFASLRWWHSRYRTNASLWTVAIAVNVLLVLALGFAVAPRLPWHFRGWIDHESIATNAIEAKSVTRLVQSHDCRWNGFVPASSGEVPTNVLLRLESGTATLQFADGAQVVLAGPCEFLPQNSRSGRLLLGKLAAQVPPQAIGFAIETPQVTVVDLGTEFGVEIDEHGTTEVQVFKGKVELRRETTGNDSSVAVRPITLTAGTARRIERAVTGSGLVSRDVALTPERFPGRRADNASTQVRQIAVEGAWASSTHEALRVDDLIRGHGLKGEKHSADWHGAMWHSDYGKIKNVIVAFDLARSHRLNSMKVWNFNDNPVDGRFAWVGVKQADIYVSTSGKGDPLSQPASWKLVADDQQFTPGTGKDDYATPTVIPLGDVEGRFVAMVIDDSLGRDPRTPPDPDIVGLSEVQFFGNRVNTGSSPSKSPTTNLQTP